MKVIDIRCPNCNRLACQLEAVHTGTIAIACKKCKSLIRYDAQTGNITVTTK